MKSRIVLVGISMVAFQSMHGLSSPSLTPHSVCDVIAHPNTYENREIVIESFIAASDHGTVLEGSSCKRGIYVSFETGKWPSLDNAIIDKASGLTTSPLHVELKGIYHSRVPFGKTTIRQLEVVDVLSVQVLR